MLQRLDHISDELLGSQIDDLCTRPRGPNGVSQGVHQVGLSETDAAADKQGVIRRPRMLADLYRGGACKLVGFSLDKGLEGVGSIQPGRGPGLFIASARCRLWFIGRLGLSRGEFDQMRKEGAI